MAYATADDVATRWGRELTAEEISMVEVRLEDAERMIRRRIPDLDNQIDTGTAFAAGTLGITDDEWAILGVQSGGMFYLTPRPVVGQSAYDPFFRRNAEDLRNHYKVIDWIRQRW